MTRARATKQATPAPVPPRELPPAALATPARGAAAVPGLWSATVALVVFVVYLILTPPVSGDKDSAEFALVLALNGVAHPTGYPIYTLLGHLWTLLVHALGATWAYAANSWSALGGAVAVFFLHRLAVALVPPVAPLDRRWSFLLTLLPVALLSFNPIWTYETTLAEVHAWHVAWMLGAAVYFARCARALGDGSDWPGRRLHAHAAAWGFLCGVGGAHHATSLFVVVPLSIALLVVLAVQRRLRPALVATVLAASLVPLASYGIIYWRASHPAQAQWPSLAPGLGGLLFHVTGQQYWGNLGRFDPSPEQAGLLRGYVWPLLFPGLVLLVVNALRARGLAGRAVAWALAFSALASTAHAFRYGFGDPSSYFLAPMVLGLVAVTPVVAWPVAGGGRTRRAVLAGATIMALAALVLWVAWLRTGSQRSRLFVSFDRYVHSMWEAIPFDTAIVFWTNDMCPKLQEWQLLGHEKPGVEVLNALSVCNPLPRARFVERHGFDPAEGLVLLGRLTPGGADSVTRPQEITAVEAWVNRMSPLPVIHFDPGAGTVRLLIKPGAGPPGSARTDSVRAGRN